MRRLSFRSCCVLLSAVDAEILYRRITCWIRTAVMLLFAFVMMNAWSVQNRGNGQTFSFFGGAVAEAQNCDVNAMTEASYIFEAQTTDPDGDDLYYTFDWADGSTTRTPEAGYVASGVSVSATHTWVDAGNYDVSSVAADNHDAISDVSNIIAVCVSLKGDLNRDGTVNVSDVQLCVNVYLGTETDPVITELADVNGDGTVNVSDVQTIVNIYLGV